MDKTEVNLDKTLVHEIIKDMHQTLEKHGVKENQIALFGSSLRNNFTANSDIDMIIISEAFEGKNLIERIDMTLKAEASLRSRYVVPMDIFLKTPKEYAYSKKAYFDSEIII